MQTSAKSITKKQQKQLDQQFYTLLGDLRHPKEVESFLNDFLSDTEKSVFIKRLAIAQLLNKGKSYNEIKQILKVSSATISSVAEIKDKPGMKLAIKKIRFDNLFDKIVGFFS